MTDTPATQHPTRKFDRVPEFDPRSRAFGVRQLTALQSLPSSRSWTLKNPVLDQLQEGACVGHGIANALSAWPNSWTFKRPQAMAFGLYHAARFVDEWPGEGDGTSVLAGCKIAVDLGMCAGYRWCDGEDDVRRTVLGVGPVVLGITWREAMYDTSPGGRVLTGGSVVGGHCLAVTGFGRRTVDGVTGLWYRWRNSWGPSYGVHGDGYLTPDDMALILRDEGEACVLVPAVMPTGAPTGTTVPL
jgi:hypothetical protein